VNDRPRCTPLFGSFLLLLVCGCSTSATYQGRSDINEQSAFHWLDAHRDIAVWNSVQAAFGQELQPDDPVKVAPVAPYRYKYVHQVGIFKTAALVIIGHRETEEDRSTGDYSIAYTYDVRTGSKSAIATGARSPVPSFERTVEADILWQWELVTLARFEPSPAPDVTFTYLSCVECESDHFLASLRYDPATNRWMLRHWGDKDSLYLGGEPDPGGNVLSYDCSFKVKDWNGDGFDDVAVRCREATQVAKRKQKIDDSTTVYTFKGGKFGSTVASGSDETKQINTELCRESGSSSLCKQHE
jgi:hypothetical protein